MLIETQTCVNNCSLLQIINKKCQLNFKTENPEEMNAILEKMVEDIKNEMTNGLDTTEVDKDKDIVIEETAEEAQAPLETETEAPAALQEEAPEAEEAQDATAEGEEEKTGRGEQRTGLRYPFHPCAAQDQGRA